MLFEQDELKNEWLSHQQPRNSWSVGSPLHLFTLSPFHFFTFPIFSPFHPSYLFTLSPFHFFTLSPTI